MISSRTISLKSIITLFALIGLFILLYASTFVSFFEVWSTDEDYSHGFLIIPVSLYLIWRNKEKLVRITRKPSNWGMGLLAVWAILYFLGYVGDISTIVSYSMILYIFGVIITLAGFTAAKLVLFPVLFLFFMMPIPSEIYTMLTNPLQLIATSASVWFMNLFDIPVYKEGNLIHLPNYSMRVIMACSGIRSLISVSALALLMGYVLFDTNVRRLTLFIVSIPVSIFGNILRITVTGLIAYFISSEMAEGYSHTLAGLVTFTVSFLILFIGVVLIQWITPENV